jgi:hypothetical protein
MNHRRVIPGRAAERRAGIEQLLGCRGIWQRNANLADARQREIEILLMQCNAKAWVGEALLQLLRL